MGKFTLVIFALSVVNICLFCRTNLLKRSDASRNASEKHPKISRQPYRNNSQELIPSRLPKLTWTTGEKVFWTVSSVSNSSSNSAYAKRHLQRHRRTNFWSRKKTRTPPKSSKQELIKAMISAILRQISFVKKHSSRWHCKNNKTTDWARSSESNRKRPSNWRKPNWSRNKKSCKRKLKLTLN